MKHSLIPTLCFWCDTGKIVDTKCMNCGAIFGSRLKAKVKPKDGFVLPMVKEATPTHIEKNRRVSADRRSNG